MNLKYIVLIIVVVIIAVLSFFYYVLRDKKLDISKEQPFVSLVNKDLVTKERCVLAKNPSIPVDNSYPYIIEDGTGYNINDLEIIKEISLGTSFTIESVELHKGAVSGATICYLFGTIVLENEKYSFNFSWGNNSIYNSNWTFPQSFFQDEGYEREFELPDL